MRVLSTGERKRFNCTKCRTVFRPALRMCNSWKKLLSRLAAINPRLRSVIEMRVFEGLTGDEIAAATRLFAAHCRQSLDFRQEVACERTGGHGCLMTDEQWRPRMGYLRSGRRISPVKNNDSFLPPSTRIRKFSRKLYRCWRRPGRPRSTGHAISRDREAAFASAAMK